VRPVMGSSPVFPLLGIALQRRLSPIISSLIFIGRRDRTREATSTGITIAAGIFRGNRSTRGGLAQSLLGKGEVQSTAGVRRRWVQARCGRIRVVAGGLQRRSQVNVRQQGESRIDNKLTASETAATASSMDFSAKASSLRYRSRMWIHLRPCLPSNTRHSGSN